MDERMIEAAISIFQPVLESAMVLAAHYAKNTGRDVVSAEDTHYAMRYCARNVTGNASGSLFPEVYEVDSDDEDDEEDYIVADVDVPDFIRYTGDDELMNSINEAWDTWAQWEPQTVAEQLIKNAVDSYDGQ
tara:strand:- start:425 stop:820 length:396 start_codon:yes stop_codon:yes gene_type:complete